MIQSFSQVLLNLKSNSKEKNSVSIQLYQNGNLLNYSNPSTQWEKGNVAQDLSLGERPSADCKVPPSADFSEISFHPMGDISR